MSAAVPNPSAHPWPTISTIVPTFREAKNLPELIERIERIRNETGMPIDVIIVDDNSRDGTEELIASLNQDPKNNWVRLIVRRHERGLSSAVVRGLEQAAGEVLVVMDADLSHPPEAIPAIVERLQAGADFVIGSRYVKGGTTDTGWGLFRWLNSKVATWMARPFTNVRDPMAGFFALRRETFQAVAAQLIPIGYKIGLELMVKCRCRSAAEVPIHFADRTRGESKLSAREQIRYIQHLGRLAKFRYGSLLRFMALIVVMALFLWPATEFLNKQSYFVDEVTQLSGLTLGPVKVTRWLAGHEAHRFGVPPDRMPPVSYWAGWLWSAGFDLSEGAMRWLGVLCVGIALILVFEASRRAWGLRAAFAAGLMMALSPNTIENAVEIRAYPLFMLFSAGALFCLAGLFANGSDGHGRRLAGMGIWSLLAMYTHFFGLLLAGSVFTAAAIMRWWRRERLAPVITVGVVVMIAALGLWPFVSAAVAKSGADVRAEGFGVGALVRFAYRGLFGHPAMSTSIIVTAAAALGFVALSIISLWPKRRGSAAAYAMLLTLGAGMVVAGIASLIVSTFESVNPSYNLWRIPAFALLLGSALAVRPTVLRSVAAVAAIVLIGASAYGAWQLVKHGDSFAHGPHRQITAVIDDLDPRDVAIVHDGGFEWGKVYFPIHYAFRGDVKQFQFDAASEVGLRVKRLPDGGENLDIESIPARYLVVVEAAEQSWRDLAERIRDGSRTLAPGPMLRGMNQSTQWRRLKEHRFTATLAVELHVFERAASVR
jgi:glycosyltransferase involved in cell wall biosynthesis